MADNWQVVIWDRGTDKRIPLAIYAAPDSLAAVQAAQKDFRNLVGRWQTGQVCLDATPYFGPLPAKPKPKRSRNLTGSLIE